MKKPTINEEMQKMVDEIRKKDGTLELGLGTMRFDGGFREFIEMLEVIHNLDDTIKKSKKKEKLSPYRLNRIILMFVNDKGESKRILIKEIAKPKLTGE